MVLVAVLVLALLPRPDPDLWWHVKVGSYIVAHHVVPARDYLSYTMVGHPWTDHEWLSEVLIYALYQLAGLWGPIVFYALVLVATYGLVLATTLRLGVHPLLALFVLIAGFIASSASWGPRVQMLTLLFLALYSYLLLRYRQGGQTRLLLLFPPIMLIWTNLHGGFVLGLALLTIVLAGSWLDRRWNQGASYPLKPLALATAASFAVTMLNPNGIRQLLYPLTFVLPNPFTNIIEESASPNFHLPVMMVFEAMLLLLVASVFIARPRLRWTHLLVIIAFTHLALSQVRSVPDWAVVVSPLLALYGTKALTVLRVRSDLHYTRRPMNPTVGRLLNSALLVLGLVLFAGEGAHLDSQRTLQAAVRQQYPVAAVNYMASHRLPPHVFVSYGWSGYLLFKLWPRYRDFMDLRADTVFNARMLHQYLTMYNATPGWRHVLRQEHVQDVLIEPTAPLARFLQLDSRWHLAYHDTQAALYTNR